MRPMYVPQHFAMTDDRVRALLDHPTADVITVHDSGLQASFLPLVYDAAPGPYGRLIGHLQRTNPQAHGPIHGEGLVIVHGTDHYASPAGLPSTVANGGGVPTWNYVTAHVRGEVVLHDDTDWCRQAVTRLSEAHEPDGAWRVGNPPADYLERLLPAVVGIEVVISGWEGKAKMAQNRTPADLEALVTRLRTAGDDEGADFLEEVSLPAARAREALVEGVRRRRLG